MVRHVRIRAVTIGDYRFLIRFVLDLPACQSNRRNGHHGEDDVRAVLLNPIHTMRSEPAVSDSQWLDAQKKLVGELGLDTYLEQLLTVVQKTFGHIVR